MIEKSQSNSTPETTTTPESSKDEMQEPKNRKYDGDYHGDDDFVSDYKSGKQKNEAKNNNDGVDLSGEESNM